MRYCVDLPFVVKYPRKGVCKIKDFSDFVKSLKDDPDVIDNLLANAVKNSNADFSQLNLRKDDIKLIESLVFSTSLALLKRYHLWQND